MYGLIQAHLKVLNLVCLDCLDQELGGEILKSKMPQMESQNQPASLLQFLGKR
jgi:hypothetical protein